MRPLILLIALTVFAGCDKPVGEKLNLVDLIITKTETPSTATLAQGITTQIKSYGPTLCYHFFNTDVKLVTSKVFEIRSKGSYPLNNPPCATALYVVDTTAKILTPGTGQYILKFYNGTKLFKSDTVQVN